MVLILLAGLCLRLNLTAALDQQVLDTEFRLARKWFPAPTANDPLIVGINEAFLDAVDEPLALSHVYLSRFLGAMERGEARVVALDFSLPQKRFETMMSTRHPDLDFHKTLLTGLLKATRQTKVIAAKVWDHDRSRFQDIQVDYAQVLAMQSDVSQAHASALFQRDADGVIRRYPGKDLQPDGSGNTFTSEIGAAMGQHGNWSGLINFRLGTTFAYIPLQDVLRLDAQGDVEALKRLFRGRAVLLGSVLKDEDMLDLPVALASWDAGTRRVPGVLAHAQVLRSMNSHAFIRPLAITVLWPLTALFALLWLGKSVSRKWMLFGGMTAILLATSSWLMYQDYWLPPSAMLLTGLLAGGGRSVREAWQNFREKQWLTRTFSGYVSPGVMREIVSGGLDTDKRGRKLPVCVLFSDIRSFTTLSEHAAAEDVVNLLNRYFARMTAVVHRHEGTVDKFIGDGMMAFFGAPNLLACPERNALAAAYDMLAALEELNAELAGEGRTPIAIGIGLHSGEAVIGHIGSPDRHEYTAIGDTVNTAARLEGLCKDLGSPIICSEHVAATAGYPPFLARLGEQRLKGRSSVLVWGLKSPN